ncbi:hypothetical protein [Bacillus sp. JJ722]|uniref:hypothetical protein n=1 Tax=Bacillus sp. JJ722 TaxID=3122973 RepID=UPI002FFDF4D7
MADITNEITSIRDFVAPHITGVKFHLQNMPEAYKAGELAIDFATGKGVSETGVSYRLDRTFQIVYFGTSGADCLRKMAPLEQQFNHAQMIHIKGTTRYLRIGSFSLSQSFKTETTGVHAIIGMLEVNLRELRPQPDSEKIENVIVDVIDTETQAPCNKNLKE